MKLLRHLRLQLRWVNRDPVQVVLPLGSIHVLLSMLTQVIKVLCILQQRLACQQPHSEAQLGVAESKASA